MHKELLTPGKLYARLSNALRIRQQQRCDGCRMPMVFIAETPKPGEPNWIVEPVGPACDRCLLLITEIVSEHANQYDLWDPTAIYARKPFAAFVPPPGPRPQ
jgi:hypothetical protein